MGMLKLVDRSCLGQDVIHTSSTLVTHKIKVDVVQSVEQLSVVQWVPCSNQGIFPLSQGSLIG
jgi:hypothetical protein